MRILEWFAITAALGFASSLVFGHFIYQPSNRGLFRRSLQLRSPSSPKTESEKEGSCGQSEIQHNVTLKGGIRAGYFRKLAQYVAMKLCVELCCEEKGCDVAFMSGRNCYGVQCFSEEQCQSIPAKHLPSEQIFVSHVTFKGEGSHKIHEPKNLKCSATRMKVGVTLRGGLKAGNFTDVGRVDNMVICTKLCCVAEKCDLAMMINQSCFLVACYSMQLCQVLKAISTNYQPSVAYVMRKTEELQEETVTKLQALHTSDSKLMCKNSQIFYNSTLRGGYKAGNFTDLGKVPNMTACVRLCCGDKNCDAAFMLERNCYAVACMKEDLCSPVHAKKSGALISLNPRLSYITSRTEEVTSKKLFSADGSCHAGVISYDVTLRGGMSAGNFTPHGKVGSMETCIGKCCIQKNCNAAMMLKDACFTVTCQRDELCEKKPIPTSSSYNPKIAFVYRDKKSRKKAAKHTTSVQHQRTKLQPKPSIKHAFTKPHGTNSPKAKAEHHKTIHSTAQHIQDNNNNNNNNNNKTTTTNAQDNSYNSTERLTRLLNETSYTEDEIKGATPKIQSAVSSHPDISQGKQNSLHDMVEYITLGTTNRTTIKDVLPKMLTNEPNVLVSVDRIPSVAKISSESSKANTSIPVTVPVIKSKIDRLSPTSFSKPSSSEPKTNAPNAKEATGLSIPKEKIPSLVKTLEESKQNDISDMEESGDDTPPNHPIGHTTNPLNDESHGETDKSEEDFQAQRFPGLSFVGEDLGCTNSEIMKNVTLRGGITAGRFRDRGEMADFRQCIKICCLSKQCDLAFMLRNNCFTVECKSEELCEAVPVKTSAEKPPYLAYIYARSTSMTKRNVDNVDSLPWTLFNAEQSLSALPHLRRRTIEMLGDESRPLLLKKRSAVSDLESKNYGIVGRKGKSTN
eukprot:Seg523.12 transcript_id=Seg523.12/GoldUCD/mRNA.D3Y31 product="hypothetical protein" protein_id=Seg523.12/GoldUCD/D3Y31